MSFINNKDLDSRLKSRFQSLNEDIQKSIEDEFALETRMFSSTAEYDIFLSHRMLDASRVLALKEKLEEDYGYSVYVDWIEDKQLSRNNVTKNTAAQIRKRMSRCKTMILAYSQSSKESLWIPWEMGYFDGLKRLVSIMPITETPTEHNNYTYKGQEYLGIYPYITEEHDNSQKVRLWVNDEVPECYVVYERWIEGKRPRIRK